ncbi:MAG: plasma-membrane proton-efflux P-type ATPase [Chlamydiota bacterium]|jgi:H+-transporting ATPase
MDDICFIDAKEAEKSNVDAILKSLKTSKEGLKSSDADSRLKKCGSNSIEEKKQSLFLKVLSYFWGPIPWMIEAAAILSLIIGHYVDFYIIFSLLVVNGGVSFWEEFQAGNAIKALKKELSLTCIAKRDGKWVQLETKKLVPGDIIKLRLGNIIPADAKLLEGDYLLVDQSTLTGESLPVTKKSGEIIYSGSIANQGEMVAVVTATGKNTFFGKTTKLVETAHPVSHFQKAVLKIGDFLIYMSIALSSILIIVQLFKHTPFLTLFQYVLILIVASIPVALPAVLSVTMALGALKLSKMKTVVTKLESIEEIAGIDVLCCDKTGTLTQNKLTLDEPLIFADIDKNTLILYGALASKEENQDPIDLAIIKALSNKDELEKYQQEEFYPFDPVKKRSEAKIKDAEGKTFHVSKGAPQIILKLCSVESSLENQINKSIDDYAKKGHRTLGIAISKDKKTWKFLGILPLFDPLREDSIETVNLAKEHGIKIKMLTGDNIAIAREISHKLNLGDNLCVADELITKDTNVDSEAFIKKIVSMNGFAEVFPEHKYDIVKALQKDKHIVGMTGDGVNDSPALKQADVGIAVSGATDAARSAASMVSLIPGLSVIIKAIEESRRIFERMNSYSIYRIAETIRIMFFITISIIVFDFYPISAIMILLLAILNDIPMLSIAYDNTAIDPKPVRWQMKRVLTISTALGIVGIISTFLLLYIAKDILQLDVNQIQSFIFLKLSVAGHQTLFLARSKKPFFFRPFPSLILLSAILTTQLIAALLVGIGIFMTPIPWAYIGLIWGYTIIWMFIADFVKILFYKHLNFESSHHQKFLKFIKKMHKNHSN